VVLKAKINSAKICGIAITTQKLVVPVDIEHIVQHAECEVLFNPGLTIHETGNLAHEGENFISSALSATAKVLASEFRYPDGSSKGVVGVTDVIYETLSTGTVVVSRNGIDLATSTSTQEIVHPTFAAGTVCASGRNELVTRILERFHKLPPYVSSMPRIHVRLGGFVGLIESKCNASIAGLNNASEFVD